MNDFLEQSRAAFRSLHGLAGVSQNISAIQPRFEAARQNRVAGLWADHLDSAAIGDTWSRYAYGQMLHSARLTAEAGRIFQALEHSVEALRLVKGPTLAVQAWPRPGLRSFDDLDFRCTKRSLNALTLGLQDLGYQPREKEVRRRENLWHFGWGISFIHTEGWIVEFNHRMFPPHFPWPERLTNNAALWSPLMLDRNAVECPVPALHLLLCCAHAVWHGWERLGWLVDIAGLLAAHPGLFAEAERLAAPYPFLHSSLHGACGVAAHIVGPLPEFAADPSTPVVDSALEILMRSEPGVPVKARQHIHHQFMTPVETVICALRRWATPGDPDFKRWPLSAPLRRLYWPLRPLRCACGKFSSRRLS